jgi:nitrite reductase/ring-hydroxylating ferredoxin subunit
MLTTNISRSVFQRCVGAPATPEPRDSHGWLRTESKVLVDLLRTPELLRPEGAVRLEGGDPWVRLLVFRGDDGRFHAVHNACSHWGRRMDPVSGTGTLQCCSLARSTFDYSGHCLRGPARRPITFLATRRLGQKVIVSLTKS